MKKIAIILMRSESKGLRDKNIALLNGRPLCFYTLDAALEAKIFDEIWISTDSQEYITLCKVEYGECCRYILREKKYAQDTTTTFETLENLFKDKDEDFIFMLLQVTSPIRKVQHIVESYNLFKTQNCRHVVSFMKPSLSRSLYMKKNEKGYLERSRHGGNYLRQNEQDYIYPNGSIWLSTKNAYLEDKTFYTEKTYPYMMSKKYSIDINDEIDLKLAEIILKKEKEE